MVGHNIYLSKLMQIASFRDYIVLENAHKCEYVLEYSSLTLVTDEEIFSLLLCEMCDSGC